MIKLLTFLLLIFLNISLLFALQINSIRCMVGSIKHLNTLAFVSLVKKNIFALLICLVILIFYICLTQIIVKTPALRDQDGKVIEGSIAELKQISINGRKEWISIRGEDQDAPVLLFLAGGPGGTQISYTRYSLRELEKYFVVVNWDQPGSGKSYNSIDKKELTADIYTEDGLALTEYLKERFGKDKIYLMGESWGSALGIFMVSEKPDNYYGFIGSGQMVDFLQTDIQDYQTVLELAKEECNASMVSKLEKLGEPPYTSGNMALKSSTYIGYLSSVMGSNPEVYGHFDMIRDMFASEYGIMDSIHYAAGLISTYNIVYPQLYGIDLRKSYTEINVPVYLFEGRYDINAPTDLAEDYYNQLNAPQKELVWFEHSGHGIPICEPDAFCKETLRVFKFTE